MMKLRTAEITVGVFIMAGILSLLMLALQVSGLSFFLKEEPGYKVKAEFSNIGALKVRAKVSLGGVVIGRVIKIALEPETFNASVWMAIDPSRVDNLPIDTQASILTAGLLGDNYISLIPGFNENEYLKEGDTIPIGSTNSAVILEQLISKFLAGQASNNNTSNNSEKSSKSGEPQVSVGEDRFLFSRSDTCFFITRSHRNVKISHRQCDARTSHTSSRSETEFGETVCIG
jgi:phospholipid/cholesterol/gamma-HCH transport system substrate-binding protein